MGICFACDGSHQRSVLMTVSLTIQASPEVKNCLPNYSFRLLESRLADYRQINVQLITALSDFIAFNTVSCIIRFQRQSSDAIADLYSFPVVTPLLGYQLHDWRAQTRSDHASYAKQTFSKKWVNSAKYRNSLGAPPLAVRWTKQRYFRNRWILMSCGQVRTSLDQNMRLPSGHWQITDFWKHADSENLGTNQ